MILQLKMGSLLILFRSKQGPTRSQIRVRLRDYRQVFELSVPMLYRLNGGKLVYQFMDDFIREYYFNSKRRHMLRVSHGLLQKNSNYRPQSPLRSPIRTSVRPVSPIRSSPFTRQTPMSPLKARLASNNSTTPTRMRANQRVQFTKSPQNGQEAMDVGFMQKTLKTGVGLFQQLANQNKIGSEKKENRLISQNINPFQYSEKKRETIGNYPKNSFAALIQNVKEIQSIQASKGHYFSNQVSFKYAQKSSHMDSTIKNEPIIRTKNSQAQPLNILQSFGSPNQPREMPEPEKASRQEIKKFDVIPVAEVEQPEQKSRVEQEPQPSKQNPQALSSFEDVILLIRKASEKIKDESSVGEEEVRMSFEQKISFNMSPFL